MGNETLIDTLDPSGALNPQNFKTYSAGELSGVFTAVSVTANFTSAHATRYPLLSETRYLAPVGPPNPDLTPIGSVHLPKLGQDVAIEFHRIVPGAGETRATRLATEIDKASPRPDNRISWYEVDAFIKVTQKQLDREKQLAANNPRAWNENTIFDLGDKLEGAAMLQNALANHEATSSAQDAAAGLKRNLLETLFAPLGRLFGSGNTPNNTES
jgi:hypothetical protein